MREKLTIFLENNKDCKHYRYVADEEDNCNYPKCAHTENNTGICSLSVCPIQSLEVTTFPTGANRDGKGGKGKFELLPMRALNALAIYFEKGADKYGDRNWEKGIPYSSFVNSGLRHLGQFMTGKKDENHLVACVWNLICLLDTKLRVEEGILPKELNDLPE